MAQGEAKPHADRAKRGRKPQSDADRRADRPIAEKRDDKGNARIVQAAQHVGERRLARIENLKDRRDAKERDRRLDRGGVLGCALSAIRENGPASNPLGMKGGWRD